MMQIQPNKKINICTSAEHVIKMDAAHISFEQETFPVPSSNDCLLCYYVMIYLKKTLE